MSGLLPQIGCTAYTLRRPIGRGFSGKYWRHFRASFGPTSRSWSALVRATSGPAQSLPRRPSMAVARWRQDRQLSRKAHLCPRAPRPVPDGATARPNCFAQTTGGSMIQPKTGPELTRVATAGLLKLDGQVERPAAQPLFRHLHKGARCARMPGN